MVCTRDVVLTPLRAMEEKYALNLPDYPGYEQVVELTQAQSQKL